MSVATAHRTEATASAPTHAKHKQRLSLGRVMAWVALIALIALTIAPFYWMLRTALSNNRALASDSFSVFPADFTWGPFKRVLGLATPQEALAEGGSGASVNFWLYMRNSIFVATGVTVGQVLFSAMAAYAFARLRWPGRDKVFLVFLSALMVPPIFTALPNFLTVKSLGLLNTLPGIMLPGLLISPFAIFFLRQFFLGLPREVEEAAMLDGAGHFRVFFKIILPMAAAPVTTLGLLTFIGSWNDYFWPLLVGQTESSRVLTVALGVFRSQTPQGAPDWAGLMAASLLAALPIMLLFLALGRWIVNSIGFTGVK
jgi:multiple sugar transport system permease protein